RDAPEELTSIANLANPFAGGASAPVEIHLVFDGDDAVAAAAAIDPIRRLGTVLADEITLKPYEAVLGHGLTPPPPSQLGTRSGFAGTASVPDVLRRLAETATSGTSPVIAIRSLGGAASRVPDDATAYAHREAELMFATTTVGPAPVVEAAAP